PRDLPPFPTRRSSDLRGFEQSLQRSRRSCRGNANTDRDAELARQRLPAVGSHAPEDALTYQTALVDGRFWQVQHEFVAAVADNPDRKSTRLNSSHDQI